MEFLNPSIDFVFKLLFRDPGDERRLIAMLTAVLEPPVPIVSAVVINPEISADDLAGKDIVLDILVRLGDGKQIDIEMETLPRRLFVSRSVFYWSKNHARQLSGGDDYTRLRPTVFIAWLGHENHRGTSIVDSKRVHSRYRILETETHRELTDHLEMHFLDMRNIAEDATLKPALRRWAEFFDSPTEETLRRLADEDPVMADTVNKLAHVSDDAASRRIAEARWKGELARWQDLDDAKSQGREEGIREGKAEGIREGKAEGIREGKAEGIREAILSLLEVRFGPLGDDVRNRVDAHSSESLKSLLERATRVQTIEELLVD